MNDKKYEGMGFVDWLQLMLIYLKFTKVIDVSWVVVLLPMLSLIAWGFVTEWMKLNG